MPNFFDQFDSPGAAPQSAPPAPGAALAAGAPSRNGGGNFFDQFDGGNAGSAPGASISSLVGNTGAGLNEAAASFLGTPGNVLNAMATNGPPGLSQPPLPESFRQQHPVAAQFSDYLRNGPFAGSDWFKSLFGLVGADPRNIVPQNGWERAARAAGNAAGRVLGVAAGARLLAPLIPESMPVTRGITETLGSAPLPTTAASAAVGAGAGQAAQDALPPDYQKYGPLVNFGTNLGVSGLTAAGLQGAKLLGGAAYDYLKPSLANVSSSIREDLAGRRLAGAATNPGNAIASLSDTENGGEIVPGSQPTTAQVTGDAGLGRLERGQAAKNSDLFNQVRAQQNAARVSALEGLAPEGAQSGAVGDYLTQRMADVDANTQAIYDAALKRAQQKALALGGNATDDQIGGVMRDELQNAADQARKAASAKFAAIDPQNNLVIDTSPTIASAKSIAGDMPATARPMSGEEAAIFDEAQNLPGAAPFRDFAALRSRVLAAIRQERLPTGDPQALRRLQMLRQAFDNTIAGAGTAADATAGAMGSAPTAETASAGTAVQAPNVGASVYTPSGRNVGVRYEVVEGDSLIPSHNQDLTPNPAYPAELQPRERGRVASEAQIAKLAGNLQPARLGASSSPGEGAPLVGPDNVVESGNARTLGILRAYQQGTLQAKAYRDYLTQQGYDVEGLNNPVLIRRRTTDLTPAERIRFTQEANVAPGLALSATERAAVDAQRLTPDTLGLYQGGDVDSVENRPFVRAFAKSVVEPTETGDFATGEGRISKAGIERVQNALLARAYGNSNVVSALAETGDENVRAFGNALKAAAGDVAKLHDQIAVGEVPERFDISAPLAQAADLVQKARAGKIPLSDVLAQRDAFNTVSPMAENLARAAYGNDLRGRLNQAKFVDLLRFYAEEAGKQSSQAQLFANEVTPEAILSAGVKRYGRAFEALEPSAAGVTPGRPGGIGAGNAAGGEEARGFGNAASGQGTGAQGARNAQVLENPLTPNFDQETAQRYRSAANAWRQQAQTFENGPVGKVLARGPGGLPYNLSDSQVAAKFFNSGARSRDDVTAYINAVGDRPAAMAALRDYAASDLRAYAGRADGTLDPAKITKWLDNHPAMRLFPETAEAFADAGSADRAIALAAEGRRAALDEFAKGAASKFLNGADPARAVESALSSGDPANNMRQLAQMVASDPAAKMGLQRAIVELMQRRFLSNDLAGDTGTTYFKPALFQNFVRNNRPALEQVFSPEQLEAMDNIAADLQRASLSVSGSKLPGGSNTTQDLLAAGHGSEKPTLMKFLAAEMIGDIAEKAGGAEMGGLWGHVLAGLYLVNSALRDAGMHKVDELVTQAMLRPELARALLLKVSDDNAMSAARAVASQLRNIAVVGAARQAIPQNGQPERRSPSLLYGSAPSSLLRGQPVPSNRKQPLLMGQGQ